MIKHHSFTRHALAALCLFALNARAVHISFSSKVVDPKTLDISIRAQLAPEEWLYKDLMSFSVDSPDVELTQWHASPSAKAVYDPAFKTTKKIFEGLVTFSMQARAKQETSPEQTRVHITFYRNKQQNPEEVTFPLSFTQPSQSQKDIAQEPQKLDTAASKPKQDQPLQTQNYITPSLSATISSIVKQTESTPIRLLLVFLLGILLSLTPCIYPMVPITAGILQAQGSKSLIYNFLLSCSYAFGMATTFAIFGLLAGCTGPLCGRLLMEPLFIAGLVAILAYLALSMFGFYEIYVPSFFKPSTNVKSSSLASTFLFGAASGTIASPCVSPGLALLLSIVATLGSRILGFMLLFTFGLGLSMPLLIIGTFSSSINLLPRAGSWMIEIKKMFGFMMLGMCLYYISYVVPANFMIWIIVLFIFICGLYYLYNGETYRSSLAKNSNRIVGTTLILGAFVLSFYGVRNYYLPHEVVDKNWHTDYQTARDEAIKSHKKLFIDFWATFCPVCLAINKTVLTKANIAHELAGFAMLKVDGTHAHHQPYARLQQKFTITGFPTFLIVDPTNEQIVAKFGGEIYDMSEEALIALLQQYK